MNKSVSCNIFSQVEDMQNNEAIWKMLPIAARNKELIKKWKQQIKVIAVYSFGNKQS